MNKKSLFLLAGALVLSFATVSLAASPPPPESDAMTKQGADFKDEKPAAPDAKVQTTGGKTYPPGDGGIKDDSLNKPGADKWEDGKPATPDKKVQTTKGKTHKPNDGGVEDNKIGGGK